VCPAAIGGVPTADVIAVFPFDEAALGATAAAVTTVSRNRVHTAFVGHLCKQSNIDVVLACPVNQSIAEITYANYGSSSGNCVGYVAEAACKSDVTTKMTELCVGKNTCTVANFATTFGGAKTCSAEYGVTLTATARCEPIAAVGGQATAWLTQDAPSAVGTFSPAATLAGAKTAVDAAAATAVAGSTLNFTVPALDACGTPATVWDAARHVVSGTITYASKIDISLNFTCPSLPRLTPLGDSAAGVLAVAAGDAGYCAERGGDTGKLAVKVMAPTAGDASLAVVLTRGKVGDADYETTSYAKSLTVAAAGVSASKSLATGSALVACEAGVPATLTVHSKDGFGNARAGADTAAINVTATGPRASRVSAPVVDAAAGAYTYTLTHPVAGEYKIAIRMGGAIVRETTLSCRVAAPRKIITFGAEPPARFEHAAATVGSDAYIFGGVLEDKSYTDQVWKFSPGTGGKWTHRRAIAINGLPAGGATAVFNVVLDTATLIADGKMRGDCADVRFALPEPSGVAVEHWIEPVGTPTGCGSATAQFWLKTNAATVHLYYGNVAAADTSTRALFSFFEDFETVEASPSGWSLDGAAGSSCGQPAGAGELATFLSSDDVHLTGSRALKAAGATKAGGAITRVVSPAMSSFFLQAYVYDSGCAGAAWVSPDWGSCTDAGSANSSKRLLPGTAVGAGVQSSADPLRYATTYPWVAVPGANRSVGWHTIAFRGNSTTLEILVDGAVAKVTKGTTLSKIMLRSDPVAGGATGADFYWDGIFAAPYSPTVAASAGAEEDVLMASGMGWSQVAAGAAATGPGARQGHTVTADGSGDLLVFGGERSGYAYGDVWRFAPAACTWTFLPAVGAGSPPPGRHDHAAVVRSGALYVFGGRGGGGAALDDFWKFTVATQEWVQLPTPPGAAARFGHTASVVGDAMLVYGGYLEASGEFTTELWSFDLASGVTAASAALPGGKHGWTKVGPRDSNFKSDSEKSVNDAIVFPSLLPPGRFSHLSLSVGSLASAPLYVLGGLDADHATPLSDAWVYDHVGKKWAVAGFPAAALSAVARYDAALTPFDALGDRVLVFGGLRGGAILGGGKGDTYALYFGQ